MSFLGCAPNGVRLARYAIGVQPLETKTHNQIRDLFRRCLAKQRLEKQQVGSQSHSQIPNWRRLKRHNLRKQYLEVQTHSQIPGLLHHWLSKHRFEEQQLESEMCSRISTFPVCLTRHGNKKQHLKGQAHSQTPMLRKTISHPLTSQAPFLEKQHTEGQMHGQILILMKTLRQPPALHWAFVATFLIIPLIMVECSFARV